MLQRIEPKSLRSEVWDRHRSSEPLLPNSFGDDHVCIVGLGYVGLTLAVAMADSGFRVHGLEVRPAVLDRLTRGRPHFWEPHLAEKLQRVLAKGRFTCSRHLDPDVRASVYIITVGTPLGADGRAQLSSVAEATRQVSGHVDDGALVVLRSTVRIGTAREIVRPILDATGKRIELAVCPERTLEGRALVELHELPQIIGADTGETRARCAQLFGMLTPTTIKLESLEAAELIKLLDNSYRDVSFAFANEVAKLCAGLGVSARDVIRAANLGYPRTNLAMPGPVGGPCLEKDPHILVESGEGCGVDMAITRAARQTNEAQPAEVAERLAACARELAGFAARPRIRVLGLAFKGVPVTDDLRGTMARPIVEALQRAFPAASVSGFDPVVDPAAARTYMGFTPKASLAEAFDGADIVVIANNHMLLQDMDLAAEAAAMRRPGIVYDFWNMHHATTETMPPGVRYLALGSEQPQREAQWQGAIS